MLLTGAFSTIVPVGIVECANIPVCVFLNPVEEGGEIGDSDGVVRRQSRYRCFPPLFMKEKTMSTLSTVLFCTAYDPLESTMGGKLITLIVITFYGLLIYKFMQR